MSKIVKDVSKDRGKLHMKLVVDTTETKKYIKQIPEAFEKVSNQVLLEVMRQVMGETQTYLKGKNSRRSKNPVWRTSKGQKEGARAGVGAFRSDTKATHKIADSLRVAETKTAGIPGEAKGKTKGQSSVSMWSQDTEFAKGTATFTSAGVRGSRAKTGKKFEGKIAEYYEQGRQPHPQTPGNTEFTHPGFPKLAYMVRAKEKANERILEKLIDGMDRKLAPNSNYESHSNAGKSQAAKGRAEYSRLKKAGVI